MQRTLGFIFWLGAFMLFWGYVLRKWVVCIRSDKQDRKGRHAVTIAGLCFATIPTVLSAFLFIHAIITGGYPFYHPVELFCIRVGALTAVLGLIAALVGKGKLGLPVFIISTVNVLLWIMDAAGQ